MLILSRSAATSSAVAQMEKTDDHLGCRLADFDDLRLVEASPERLEERVTAKSTGGAWK
jgi:hypothetical protein